MYVRNYGNGLDLPWQKVFQTDDRARVDEYCARASIEERRIDGHDHRDRCAERQTISRV